MMSPETVFDIPAFWAKMVNSQLTDISLTGCLRFPSLITYLFFYTHVERFMHLRLNIMDPHKNKQSVVFWTDVVRSTTNNEGLMHFITSFLLVSYSMINSSPPPFILPKAQCFLQLSKDVKVGDWFIFEDYAKIRLYGSEVVPYKLPIFVPMRLISLEFIRLSLNVDQVHFVLAKKGHPF